ncbi:hypothetical protein C2I33_14680 [Ralstonia solanacearum]|nr:hypothetical protein C2I33_14680 [Ralstonia solanacearum]
MGEMRQCLVVKLSFVCIEKSMAKNKQLSSLLTLIAIPSWSFLLWRPLPRYRSLDWGRTLFDYNEHFIELSNMGGGGR